MEYKLLLNSTRKGVLLSFYDRLEDKFTLFIICMFPFLLKTKRELNKTIWGFSKIKNWIIYFYCMMMRDMNSPVKNHIPWGQRHIHVIITQKHDKKVRYPILNIITDCIADKINIQYKSYNLNFNNQKKLNFQKNLKIKLTWENC